MLDGGQIVVRALEDAGVRRVFGVPGTHNVALYDALAGSKARAVLVTDERAAAFMADGVSRASEETGVVALVPGAGLTHALSGVAEAYLDQVPMVVLACAVRSDSGRAFQLHDIDQAALLKPVTKAVLRPRKAGELYGAVREAFELARAAPAGPVAVEVPAELYLLSHLWPKMEYAAKAPAPRAPAPAAVEEAARLLGGAKRPVLCAGYGARGAQAALTALAERLGSPVATTIQGKGVFPETHPLWLWSVAGRAAPRFAARELEQADVILALGCRFSEVGTGSYDLPAPRCLIHVDADAGVFGKNFPASLAIEADAGAFLDALLPKVEARPRPEELERRLKEGHAKALASGEAEPGRVSPKALFDGLQRAAPQAVYAADSGNGLFLAMERLRLDKPGRFLAPVDFSCMGYSVPAAIGAKFARPEADVIAVAGDGALLMTGLSLMTSVQERAPVVVCALKDGELGQIAQFQRLALGRAAATKLPDYSIEGLARLCRAAYFLAGSDDEVPYAVERAIRTARGGRSAVIEVPIDVSQPIYFTKGVLRANFARLPPGDKLRLAIRKFFRRATSWR